MALLTLTILVLVAVLAWKWYTGRAIVTPIPAHLARRGRDLSNNGLGMTLYRLVLVVAVLASGVLTALVNPTGVLAFFAAGLFLWVFMDDLQKTLIDVWNADFWRVEP